MLPSIYRSIVSPRGFRASIAALTLFALMSPSPATAQESPYDNQINTPPIFCTGTAYDANGTHTITAYLNPGEATTGGVFMTSGSTLQSISEDSNGTQPPTGLNYSINYGNNDLPSQITFTNASPFPNSDSTTTMADGTKRIAVSFSGQPGAAIAAFRVDYGDQSPFMNPLLKVKAQVDGIDINCERNPLNTSFLPIVGT